MNKERPAVGGLVVKKTGFLYLRKFMGMRTLKEASLWKYEENEPN